MRRVVIPPVIIFLLMTRLNPNAALVLIDIQQGFEEVAYWGGGRNNPGAEQQAAALLAAWRARGLPVFHVKHNSTTPQSPLVKGKPGNALHLAVVPLPGEPLIEKQVNSPFVDTDIHEQLQAQGISQLVVAGMTTDHCVSTTVRMAANMGYAVIVVSDATATFDKTDAQGRRYDAQLVHDVSLASLKDEFAAILTATDVIVLLIAYEAAQASSN